MSPLPFITHAEALAQGFTIDNHASGRPIAYRGPRYAPTAVRGVFTDNEETARNALRAVLDSKTLTEARDIAAQALNATQHG